MIFQFDKFDRYATPSLYLCNPNEEIIGRIGNFEDFNVTPKFNDMSEISFEVVKYLEDHEISPLYDKIEKIREILVDDFYVREEGINEDGRNRTLGYFVITDVQELQTLSNPTKTVTALSCEYELSKRELHYIDGVYKIYEPGNDECLLNQILKRVPKWTLRYIDESVASLYRTFEFSKNTVYNFLTQDFANSCDAIIEFDIYERAISIYSKDNYISTAKQYSGITMSLQDVVKDIKISSDISTLYTSFYVPSNGDLNIAGVNPSMNNTIYNFDYYMNGEWMSQGLIDALTTVKNNIASAYSNCVVEISETLNSSSEAEYQIVTHSTTQELNGVTVELIGTDDCELYINDSGWTEITPAECTVTKPLNIMLSYENEKQVTLESELQTLKDADLAGLEQQRAAIISSSVDADIKNNNLETINQQILDKQAEIIAKREEVEHKAEIVAEIYQRLLQLSLNTRLEEVLTIEQMDELAPFIHESTFEDQTIITTDIMNYLEEYEQSANLYERAVKSLKYVSTPACEFSVNVDSAFFNKNFAHLTEVLNTGAVVSIIDDDEIIYEYILHQIKINFQSNTINLVFGNRFYLSDPQQVFSDLYASTSKTGSTLNYIKDTFNFKEAKAEISKSEEFRRSSLNLSRNNILSSDNQSVVIDDTGYHGRRMDEGEVDPEQCWLVNNALVFTDDAFATVKTALGKIPYYDPVTGEQEFRYGLNADCILAGTIDAGLVRTGRIVFGNNYIDLDTGELYLESNVGTQNDGSVNIGELNKDFTGFQNELNTYFQFGTDGIKIGTNLDDATETSGFSTVLTSTALQFKNGEDIVAQASGSSFDMVNAKVENTQTFTRKALSGAWDIVLKSNGDLAFKWKEKENTQENT